jgi:hypothetical protein
VLRGSAYPIDPARKKWISWRVRCQGAIDVGETMKFIARATASLVFILSCGSANASPLDKNSVLQLTQMGLGDDAVVAKIQADKVDFDLSTEDMLQLKKQGMSSPVIAALITNRYVAKIEPSLVSPDPAIPHPAGFYALMNEGPSAKMERMEPTVTN